MLPYLVRRDVELQSLAPEPRRTGHLQIQSCEDRLSRAVGAEPVTHHKALPTPLAPEQPVQQFLVLAAVRAVDTVVCSHEARRIRVPHCDLEGLGVDLPQRPIRHNGLRGVALMLEVIAHEVLDSGLDALTLYSVDESRGSEPSQHRVLAYGLETSAAQW